VLCAVCCVCQAQHTTHNPSRKNENYPLGALALVTIGEGGTTIPVVGNGTIVGKRGPNTVGDVIAGGSGIGIDDSAMNPIGDVMDGRSGTDVDTDALLSSNATLLLACNDESKLDPSDDDRLLLSLLLLSMACNDESELDPSDDDRLLVLSMVALDD